MNDREATGEGRPVANERHPAELAVPVSSAGPALDTGQPPRNAADDATSRDAAGDGESLDEATLVGRAQDGDPGAFEKLFDCYQERLFRHAYRMLMDQTSAEDVVQDTFIAAWQYLPSLLQPGAFRGWLYQIATRRSLDALRVRQAHLPLDEQTERAGHRLEQDGQHDPAALQEQKAQLESLQQVLTGLPPIQRVIWAMREIDGLSYDEIARATKLPASTVRGRIARTRRQIAEGMSPWR